MGGGQRLSTILGQATYNIYLLGGCIGYLLYYAMGPSYLLGGVGWVVRTVLSTVSFTLASLFTVSVTGHAMNNGSRLHLQHKQCYINLALLQLYVRTCV